ncbi:MAG: hypothetical protein NZ874_06815 [Fimbriimonadales bacterium]|nr:hypothetical protein [Fimbriimonadales bacterium]
MYRGYCTNRRFKWCRRRRGRRRCVERVRSVSVLLTNGVIGNPDWY